MLFGYLQKVVIADKLAIIVNTVFGAPDNYSSIILAFGAIAFSIQIYCDFAGYSSIAIGAAQVLGFHMMDNFDAPYFSSSIREFWRRWHISLSSWFKDYVYIPLGGNRCSKWRKYFNLMVTFLVSGLWHGAHGHYVVWGGIHGVYQIAESEITAFFKRHKWNVRTDVFSFKLLRILITYFLTVIAWIFFRAEKVSAAVHYIIRMFTDFQVGALFDGSLFQLGVNANDMRALIFCILLLILADCVRHFKGMRIDCFIAEQNLWFRWVILIVVILCIIIFGEYGINYDSAEFIYFQF